MSFRTRLQLRWEATDKPADEYGYRDWICHYELALGLDEHDVRREDEGRNKVRDHIVIEFDTTKRGSLREPCRKDDGSYYFDSPFRDGAHSLWDSKKLGGLPIVCISVDGTIILSPKEGAA